jgi:putative transposase
LHKESEVVEGNLKVDHVHVVLSVPPKYSVSQVVGYMKGKSAIWVAKTSRRNRNFVGQHFWARGYYVSTVDLDEEAIRGYVRSQ